MVSVFILVEVQAVQEVPFPSALLFPSVVQLFHLELDPELALAMLAVQEPELELHAVVELLGVVVHLHEGLALELELELELGQLGEVGQLVQEVRHRDLVDLLLVVARLFLLEESHVLLELVLGLV